MKNLWLDVRLTIQTKVSFVSFMRRATMPPISSTNDVVNMGIAWLVYMKWPKQRDPNIPAIREAADKNP